MSARTRLGEEAVKSLMHHGVLGMKWGIRKDRSTSGPTPVSVTQKKPGGKVKTSGGKGHPLSEDALKTLATRQKAKASSTHSLSNAELRSATERMQLEANFARLNESKKNAGVAFIAKFFKNPNNRKKTAEFISENRDRIDVGKTVLNTDLSKIGA